MELTDEILVQKTTKSKLPEVDFNKLGFGNYVSDHMLICNYANGQWQAPALFHSVILLLVLPPWHFITDNRYLKA